nr:MAG TPA: hypothetical protein [Caudoviricetes sp.]
MFLKLKKFFCIYKINHKNCSGGTLGKSEGNKIVFFME